MNIQSNQVYTEIKLKDLNSSNSEFFEVDFEKCEFHSCNFEESKFNDGLFEECTFHDCIFNNCKLPNTRFSDCKFKNCRIIGIDWTQTRHDLGLEINAEKTDFSYGLFSGIDISECELIECKFHEADFSNTNLHKTKLAGSDFLKSKFDHTNLSETDFTDAINYIFNPSENICKDMKVSPEEAIFLLEIFGIKIV